MMDLLGLDGDDDPFSTPAAPPPPASKGVELVQVLGADKAGPTSQKTGLRILAGIERSSGETVMHLRFENQSVDRTMSGFAIQINKNPFGLAPKGALDVRPVAPGGSSDTTVGLVSGQLLSGQPLTNPLYLQVAIKQDVDVFYFTVQHHLESVLTETSAMDQEAFRVKWQEWQGDRMASFTGVSNRSWSTDSMTEHLRHANLGFVAARQAAGEEKSYFSCTLVNQLAILVEVGVAGDNVRVVVRAQVPVLLPHMQQSMARLLGLSQLRQ
jgi:AP-1 complex subunit beta-1